MFTFFTHPFCKTFPRTSVALSYNIFMVFSFHKLLSANRACQFFRFCFVNLWNHSLPPFLHRKQYPIIPRSSASIIAQNKGLIWNNTLSTKYPHTKPIAAKMIDSNKLPLINFLKDFIIFYSFSFCTYSIPQKTRFVKRFYKNKITILFTFLFSWFSILWYV